MLDNQARMAGPEKKKILVVEDEKDIRELVRYNLEQEGFSVLEAEEGEFALALVQRERPALVILDIMLPGMSGLEICRAIRLGDETARLPILVHRYDGGHSPLTLEPESPVEGLKFENNVLPPGKLSCELKLRAGQSFKPGRFRLRAGSSLSPPITLMPERPEDQQ